MLADVRKLSSKVNSRALDFQWMVMRSVHLFVQYLGIERVISQQFQVSYFACKQAADRLETRTEGRLFTSLLEFCV